MTQMNLFTKQKQTYRHRKQTYTYQKGRGSGRDELGIEISRNVLSVLYTK